MYVILFKSAFVAPQIYCVCLFPPGASLALCLSIRKSLSARYLDHHLPRRVLPPYYLLCVGVLLTPRVRVLLLQPVMALGISSMIMASLMDNSREVMADISS